MSKSINKRVALIAAAANMLLIASCSPPSATDETSAPLSGSIISNQPIYSLVNGASYTGRIVLRARLTGTVNSWKYGGTACSNATAIPTSGNSGCLATPYVSQPSRDSAHDWRCEVNANVAFNGTGSRIIRACDGVTNPSVTINVTGAGPSNAFATGIFLQQKPGETQIQAQEAKYLAGANLLVFWSELQPTINSFSDGPLNDAVNKTNAASFWTKWILLVKTGTETFTDGSSSLTNGSPQWLLATSPSNGLGRPLHKDGIGTGPYPWDSVYQDLAQNLMGHVGSVVRSDTTLTALYIAGATSHYNEMILPSAPDPSAPGSLTQNETVPPIDLSCQHYIDAWERAIDTMNSQFNIKVITPLDYAQDCSSGKWDAYNALNAYSPAVSPLSMRALGTANVGYFQNAVAPYMEQNPLWWDNSRQFFDRKGNQAQTEYWEMGPNKMGPDNPSDTTMASRVKTVTSYLGSTNSPYFYSDTATMLTGTWTTGSATRRAVCQAVLDNPPWHPASGAPSCSSYTYGLK